MMISQLTILSKPSLSTIIKHYSPLLAMILPYNVCWFLLRRTIGSSKIRWNSFENLIFSKVHLVDFHEHQVEYFEPESQLYLTLSCHVSDSSIRIYFHIIFSMVHVSLFWVLVRSSCQGISMYLRRIWQFFWAHAMTLKKEKQSIGDRPCIQDPIGSLNSPLFREYVKTMGH